MSHAFAAGRIAWQAAPVHVAAQVVLAAVAAGLPVLSAWLTKSIVDGLTAGSPAVSAMLGLAAGLMAAGLALALLPRVVHHLEQEAGRAITVLTRDRLYAAVGRLQGMARFEDPAFLDRLRMAQQGGGQSPGDVVGSALAIGSGALTSVGFVGALLLISPVMAMVVVAAAVPVLVAQLRLSRRRAAMMWSIGSVERRELFFESLLLDVQAAKEIRLFGAAAFLRGRMQAERRAADVARRRMDLRDLRTQGGLSTLSAGVAGGGLVWAVVTAAGGAITPGDVMLLAAGVAGVQGALTSVATSIARLHQQLLMFGHYVDVVSAEPDLEEVADPRPAPELRNGIELRDVWFRYADDLPWVLSGVTVLIPAGQAVALVGRNGAGKSTLVKLLCRFYDPTKGAILWDGIDIRELDVASLRRRIGAVFQDFMDYDLTAAENIAIGDVDALDDRPRLAEAARRSGIHATIDALPRGYDTMLSRIFTTEDGADDPATGVAFSGGQWQRLALARAFVREGQDLLILDEPSSGLDAVAEHEVHTSLREHRRGRTSVLISHRLSAVRAADRLVVLSGGAIVEEGTHDELLRTGGVYAELFRLQAAGYAEDDANASISQGPDNRSDNGGNDDSSGASRDMLESPR
ncbi:ABC transporter ATP-binding protein [Pseudonocardia sp. CA-107938]|uniref:ABC transporter ATP-binding protein n=1 Tax=Pseudonocardia sp. CA-107938 TaxID=3240021 RepID=UPI003D8AABBD